MRGDLRHTSDNESGLVKRRKSVSKRKSGDRHFLPVVSLFCGPGGFDVGFEQAGFTPVLAIDAAPAACKTFKHNHAGTMVLRRDLSSAPQGYVSERLREHPDSPIPVGVIGGPPCQAFSLSNGHKKEGDPRAEMPRHYAAILKELNCQYEIDFFVFENVLGLKHPRHQAQFEQFKRLFAAAGFTIFEEELNAADFGVAQVRKRVFVVGFNNRKYPKIDFSFPSAISGDRSTVRDAIINLPPAFLFKRGAKTDEIPHHPNHWCMQPKSSRFTNGTLKQGEIKGRAFRVLQWDEPSWTVAYGHREVHIHPSGKRRLSVYEAMLLQGFPPEYVLCGTLSDQIRMVSDAVAPPVAKAVAQAIRNKLRY
jgi:DNA (cytosine-5)-methyltransferase 1